MIGPPIAAGAEGDAVVVVVGELVGVVVGGEGIGVVAGGVPPPLPPPLPPLPDTGVDVLVVEEADVCLAGGRRLITPENSRFPFSFASFMRIAVLSEFGPRLTNDVVAEASMLIMATRRPVVTPRVTNFGIRCAVFAKTNLLIESMYM
jgi:hypothetical protein